jgi:hypothetical protein
VLVDLVVIHHEGAGAPTDNVARFLDTDSYSAGIGITLYELRRDPADSFINNVDDGRGLQVCLSGNRMDYPVTDTDIGFIGAVCDEARARGWVTDTPTVYHHGDRHPSACPGTHTNERRAEIAAACQASREAPPNVGDDEMPTGAQQMVTTKSGNGYYVVGSDGGIFCFGDAQFYGSTGDLKLNAPIVGMELTETGRGYWLIAQDGGIFSFGDAAFYGAPTGKVR